MASGEADLVGVLGGEAFHLPGHVVAEIADEAAEHGGEIGR